MTHLEAFQELSYYTLAKGDIEFIHQHAVDAYAVQHAVGDSKPISLVFGLVGLYLSVERGWTGREVQLFHMKMARHKRPWPEIALPEARGSVTVKHVMGERPGAARDALIMDWCRSVWESFADVQLSVREMVMEIEPLR